MESVCYQKLDSIEQGINEQIGFSYANLDKIKESNILDKILELNDIPNCLKNELITFLNILVDQNFNNFPYLRKIFLHESSFTKIFGKFGYIISLYLDNTDCYRVFPLFVKEMIDKFDLNYYKNLPIENMINKSMDIDYAYNPNAKRNLAEVFTKIKNNYTDYSKYDEKIRNNRLNINDQTEFFIWSEYITYMLEYNVLKSYPEYNTDCVVRWVSKDHGDGYGFDILSYDPILRKQKLIEVKSGKSDWIDMTRNELRVLYEAMDKNCDYYIYRYYCSNLEPNKIELYRLKYDMTQEKFIDVNDPNNTFYMSPYFYFENNSQKVGISIEKEKEYVKTK